MSNEKPPRTYRMQRRAEQQELTRLRITEATMHLHETVGPARTSISSVAERAGVERATVYRHFPDEPALFGACGGLWIATNPPPDPEAWALTRDPGERFSQGLTDLYAYYARTEGMFANLLRDAPTIPALGEMVNGWMQAHFGALGDALMHGRTHRGRARRDVRAAIGHAVAFETWRSLVRTEGLTETQAVRLMCGLVEAAAKPVRVKSA